MHSAHRKSVGAFVLKTWQRVSLPGFYCLGVSGGKKAARKSEWQSPSLPRPTFLQAGFTLIELLVALFLLSVIFLLVNSAITFGQRNWSVGEENDSEMSSILVTQGFVRQLLSEALPVKILAGKKEARLFFVGRDNSIRFIAPLPHHLGVGGYYQIAIYLAEQNDSGNSLEISWQLFRGITELPDVRAKHQVLLRGIDQLNFEYFGSHIVDSNGKLGAARWYRKWEDTRLLPYLIRMRVEFKRSDRLWPDLVVAPMVQTLDLKMETSDGTARLD